MNGVSCQETGYSEFVEVDPTGRYGRVFYSLFSFPLSLPNSFHLGFHVFFLFVGFSLL